MAHRKGFYRGRTSGTSRSNQGPAGGQSSGGNYGAGNTSGNRGRDPEPSGSHHGGEWSGPTYSKPDTVTYEGPSRGEGIGSQTFNKNFRTIQKRYDYNRLAKQRANPFLSKLGGLGGLLKGIGKAGLSFFGGIPGKALSGIMTASDYAKRKGSGVLEGIEEFGEHDNLMSYLNRNKVQALQPIESMPTNQEIIGKRIGQDEGYYGTGSQYDQSRVMPENITTNMGANNQMIDPNFLALGAKDGGRIGYAYGTSDPEEPAENVFEFMQDQNIPFSDQVEGEEGVLEQLIAQYIEAGFPPDQAEAMAMQELQAMSQGSEQGIASLV